MSLAAGSPAALFRVAVAANTNLTARLDGLSGAANLELVKDIDDDVAASFDDLLDTATAAGTQQRLLTEGLTPGVYCLRVIPGAGNAVTTIGIMSVTD